MRVAIEELNPVRSAMFLGAAVMLVAVASLLLLISIGFGITAGDTLGAEGKSHLERAANLSFGMFGVVELALAALIVKWDILRPRLHWSAMMAVAAAGGSALSYVIVMEMVWHPWLAAPFAGAERVLSDWVQSLG